MTQARRIKLGAIVSRGDWSHVGRTVFSQSRKVPFHRHDFAEVFWVEQGKGVHIRNGREERLAPGVVCFIRPQDLHGFRARESDGLVIMNVAFFWSVVADLTRRYSRELDIAPWSRKGTDRYELSTDATDRLTRMAQELTGYPASRMRVDRFLIEVLSLASAARQGKADPRKEWPAWLTGAADAFNSPAWFGQGVPGFSVLADKSPEHINRTVKKLAGITTTELVNDLRIDWAARQLRLTEQSVTKIALDAGLSNVGYFIRLFKGRHGSTPEAYRKLSRAALPMG